MTPNEAPSDKTSQIARAIVQLGTIIYFIMFIDYI